MGYIEKDQILLYEELCSKPFDEGELINRATILFRENINLVYYAVNKFRDPKDPSVDKDDLLQEGYIGLWKACLNYDESSGFAFSTYAVPMIRGTVLRMLRETSQIKTPRSHKDISNAIYRYGFELPLSEEEIEKLVNECHFSRENLIEFQEVNCLSLDTIVTEKDTDSTLQDLLPDTSIKEYSEELSEDELESAIDELLTYVNPRYRDMLEEWMYAVIEGEHISQSDLGAKYGIKQVQVSRSINAAKSAIMKHGEKVKELFGM